MNSKLITDVGNIFKISSEDIKILKNNSIIKPFIEKDGKHLSKDGFKLLSIFNEKCLSIEHFNALLEGFSKYNDLRKVNFYEYEYKNCEDKYQKFNINFPKKAFLHLTGVKYCGSASKFYEKLKQRKLHRIDVFYPDITNKSLVEKKLSVIRCLPELIDLNKVRVSENCKYLNLESEILIRSNRNTIGLSLKMIKEHYYIPQSLLNLHGNKGEQDSFKITKIEKKR